MYYIHYPSGGFGHFMLQMPSICFDDVFCPQETSTFSSTGNSHDYPLHCKTWLLSAPFIKENYYDFKNKKSICLIDSGIHDAIHRGTENTIRMCIDEHARSIVFQTCKEKAEQLNFNFDLEESEIGCILGPSGCGKSSLLRAIAGFENINSGSILKDGVCISNSLENTSVQDRKMGMVFQDYALFPNMDVKTNIAFGLKNKKLSSTEKKSGPAT